MMHIVKFVSSKLLPFPSHIAHNNQALSITENIKFLDLHLECNLTLKLHSDNSVKLKKKVQFASS